MKTKFLVTVAAFATMALTSCQKDGANQNSVDSGQDTHVSLKIKLPESLTESRSVTTENGLPEESRVNVLMIGIWREGERKITYTAVTPSPSGDVNEYYASVPTKTGVNNIFAIANSSASGLPTLEEIRNNESLKLSNRPVAGGGLEMISGGDGIETIDVGLEGAAVYIGLVRTAAKVAVTSSFNDKAIVDYGSAGSSRVTDLKWMIKNMNELRAPFPGGTDFLRFVDLAYAPKSLPKAGEPASIDYCPENAYRADNSMYLEENTTAVEISGTYIPSSYITEVLSIEGEFTKHDNSSYVATTFYVSKKDIGTIYAPAYFNEAGFNSAIAMSELTIDDFVKYENGKCFWPVWIRNDKSNIPVHRKYGVERNHMYTMNIAKIHALGYPSFPDTDVPVDQNTSIHVELTVMPWNANDMGDIEL